MVVACQPTFDGWSDECWISSSESVVSGPLPGPMVVAMASISFSLFDSNSDSSMKSIHYMKHHNIILISFTRLQENNSQRESHWLVVYTCLLWMMSFSPGSISLTASRRTVMIGLWYSSARAICTCGHVWPWRRDIKCSVECVLCVWRKIFYLILAVHRVGWAWRHDKQKHTAALCRHSGKYNITCTCMPIGQRKGIPIMHYYYTSVHLNSISDFIPPFVPRSYSGLVNPHGVVSLIQ